MLLGRPRYCTQNTNMASTSETKRSRKKNFTPTETISLIEEFSTRKRVLQSKFKSTLTNKDKQKAWEDVTAAVNAVGLVERSVAEVKEKWSKLSSDARAQLRARKHPPTGSGKAVEMPNLELFENIFQDSDIIEGIAAERGGFDSGDMPHHEAYPTSRSLTPEPHSPPPADPLWEIRPDEQGILHLTGLPETSGPSSMGSDRTPARPGAALDSAVRESTLTAGGSGVAPTRKASHGRGTTAQDIEREALYGKYLAISIELKDHLKRKLESDVPDADEKEKKHIELQRRRVALEVQEMEKEKLMAEMKQAAEIRELEKEKLKLEIQLLKEKLAKANK